MTQMLTEQEQDYLLNLARQVIESALQGNKRISLPEEGRTPRLQEPGASFVTLHTAQGALRGCIGTLTAHRPLAEDVRHNALAAAFDDPRFPPLSETEAPDLGIEVSVLTPPEPLAFSGPDELVQKLRPRIDGVFLEHGWHRGTFLPQVWEHLPEPEEFLRHLALKAHLPANAWRWPDIKISTYQVQKFGEVQDCRE